MSKSICVGMGVFTALLIGISPLSYADSIKRGVSLCLYGDCRYRKIKHEAIDEPQEKPQENSKSASAEKNEERTESKKAEKQKPKPAKVNRAKNGGSSIVPVSAIALSDENSVRNYPKVKGNLPSYYQGVSWSGFTAGGADQHVAVFEQNGAKLSGLKRGDVLFAVIEDSLEVWPGVEAPVRAFVIQGPFKNAWVSGLATLDPSRKKIMISFSSLRPNGAGVVYKVQARARSTDGRLGLQGEYHSESGKFFVAQMLASTAAGITDASIQRNTNAFGTYTQEPSLGNYVKSGVATAINERSKRFEEQERAAPEWAEKEGVYEVQIFIESDPVEDIS